MKCLWCGGVLPARVPGVPGRAKRYCSPRCQAQAAYGRKHGKAVKPVWDVRECRNCGGEFVPRQANQISCSRSCSRTANNRERRAMGGNYYRRLLVLERGGCCEACGVPGPDGLEVHHVVPLSEGGEHLPSNVRVLCDDCQ